MVETTLFLFLVSWGDDDLLFLNDLIKFWKEFATKEPSPFVDLIMLMSCGKKCAYEVGKYPQLPRDQFPACFIAQFELISCD